MLKLFFIRIFSSLCNIIGWGKSDSKIGKWYIFIEYDSAQKTYTGIITGKNPQGEMSYSYAYYIQGMESYFGCLEHCEEYIRKELL